MTQDDEIRCYQRGAIGWIRFNRPEARNAMTWHMYESMIRACQQFDEDETVALIAFRGEGGEAFVAGTDIKQFVDFRERGDGIDYERRIDAVIGGIERLETPTVALIDGYCVGGGAAIAMACDFRYANANFKFGIPIARTLGNCMSITNVARLVDLIGIARTKRVLMLAKMIGAEEALSVGLIDEIAPDPLAAADAIARAIAANAQHSVRSAKAIIRRILDGQADDDDATLSLFRDAFTLPDFTEGAAAFREKRRPNF